MKAQALYLAAIFGLLFISCKQDNTGSPTPHNPPPNPGTPEIVTNVLSTGTWKVTSYIDNTTDKTSLVSSYLFHFSKSGSCTADNGSNTYTGMWHCGWDDTLIKLRLTFPIPGELAKISGNWQVIETTESKVLLIDTSGGTDLLIFKKL